ncbi:hypothetical protein QEN19_001069 [Hanseniaspora menglaensis]
MDSETGNLAKLYNFKPMYTRQENEKVLKTQLESWASIIKSHYRATKTFKFEAKTNNLLFLNLALHRNVAKSFQDEIINSLYLEGCLVDLIDLKQKLTKDKKFIKTWNLKQDTTEKSSFLKVERPLEADLENRDSQTYIFYEDFEFFTQLFLEYMDMNSGKDNIFTLYELSKCDSLYTGKTASPFVSKVKDSESFEDENANDQMPLDMLVYIVYRGLIDKQLVYPIFEEEELVAIKKI